MADVFSKAKRSEVMSRIRSRGNLNLREGMKLGSGRGCNGR
jgi:G:T-mismatch repair DNA endonuclease (very short patch repair protein)